MMKTHDLDSSSMKWILTILLLLILVANANSSEINGEQDRVIVVEEDSRTLVVSDLALYLTKSGVLNLAHKTSFVSGKIIGPKRADFLTSVETASDKKAYSRWLIPLGVVIVSFGITYSLYSIRSS